MNRTLFVILSAASLSACASLVEGPSQTIAVNTVPSGAKCTLNRNGQVLATINQTPGSATIVKNKQDINVVCQLDGYMQTAQLDESGTAVAVFGNVLIGGLIGVATDMATGSYNKYDSPLTIALQADAGAAVNSAAPAPVVALAPVQLPPPPPAAESAAPIPAALSLAPPPPAAIPPASAAMVDMARAERMAARFRVLHRLAVEGLIPQSRYDAWAQQNAGAFLLSTAAPPLTAVGYKVPAYQELADFLKALDGEKNLKVAEAEREALLRAIMPAEGPRAEAVKPPADEAALREWYAFLDKVKAEGLLPAAWIDAEKASIQDTRQMAGLPEIALR